MYIIQYTSTLFLNLSASTVGCHIRRARSMEECYETQTNLPYHNLEQFVTSKARLCTWLNCIMIIAVNVIFVSWLIVDLFCGVCTCALRVASWMQARTDACASRLFVGCFERGWMCLGMCLGMWYGVVDVLMWVVCVCRLCVLKHIGALNGCVIGLCDDQFLDKCIFFSVISLFCIIIVILL